MWKAYSAGYIRNNKTGNRFIMTISFLASALLSLVSGLFYNLWADQVQKAVAETGTSRVEMTPAIIAYIIVFSVASIALIMMIHHAFAATMTNRIHQLGILKSVGATRRQIRKALTNEVMVLSLPAIVIGNIVGIGLAWLFMIFIITSTASLRDYTLTFVYHPIVFLGSFAFSVLTALISAWIPAKKLSRITPLDAIRYGNEPVIKRVKKYRVHSVIFGIYGELASKSLYARRKSMRIGTMSILLAVFACVSLLNMFGISNLSTEKTYFDRFKDNWDFLVTSEEGNYSKELLDEIRNIDGVSSCIVHKIVSSNTQISGEYLSGDVQKLGLENLNSSFVANDARTYNVNTPIYILDDNSFERYRGEKTDANVIAVNIIWDSIHSERTNRQYVPFLNDDKEILLDLEGITIPNSTETIGQAAFLNCTSLDSLIFTSDAINFIGDSAFYNCTNLSYIRLPDTIPPTIKAQTFHGVDTNIPVFIPANCIERYKADPYWNRFINFVEPSITTAIETISHHQTSKKAHKCIENNHLIILLENQKYNVMGRRIK